MHRTTHLRRLAVPLIAVALLAGCKSGEIATENDALRRQVLELQKENEQLKRREQELMQELREEAARPDSLPPEVRESTPHVADVSIGRLSHARDRDDDGVPDVILLYVNPADGYGRFEQMVGTLSAHAIMTPPNADAITVGRVTLDPRMLREAYRSGVTGTHYTIELPVEVTDQQANEAVLVRVRYEDGRTGAVHTAEREIALRD